jgi:hypothetical protein
MAKPSPKPINIAVQLAHLRTMFPTSTGGIHIQNLSWRGQLQPTEVSRVYTIHLSYRMKHKPIVRVINAPWEKSGTERPPHTFADGSLCLYYPAFRDFDYTMLLAKTIIPWASEWLFHYEIWLATGQWLGGGIHPGVRGKIEIDP